MSEDNDSGPDQDQKTEEPSQRRLEKAQEKGQAPISKEVINWVFVMMCAVIIIWILPYLCRDFLSLLVPFLAAPHQIVINPDALTHLSFHIFTQATPRVAIPLMAMFLVLIAVGILQTRGAIRMTTLKPKLSRLSLKQGIKKIFSKNAVIEFLKVFLKTIFLFLSLYMMFKNHAFEIKNWTNLSLRQMLNVVDGLLFKLFLLLLISFFMLALFDYLYQRYDFMKGLRMTKQEQKDEYKDVEGDPQIKQKIRRLQMDRARNRMMQNVPDATVIVTNPTHYSVALSFDDQAMLPPKVVAKGQDHIALLIREMGKKHNVPIVENPPVARDLYDRVEIDQEIPHDTYKVVADIIRFVMKLKDQQF